MTDRQFPILATARELLPKLPAAVPWSFVEPHEKQAQTNHSQSLARLAERGGLTWQELADVIEGKRWDWKSYASKSDPRLIADEANAACRVLDLLKLHRPS